MKLRHLLSIALAALFVSPSLSHVTQPLISRGDFSDNPLKVMAGADNIPCLKQALARTQ